ncbi:MAG: DUF1571 domain-containing protein [Planctomycetaceae bacterium]|nr:DUF1571 domain-containing protein [Planctomycetaceae bacterium]MDG2389552.1 DUF1571 domain-containing protein [Planctomycetaceae bacterium]
MERRQFVNLVLSSVGTSLVFANPLQLIGAEPIKLAAALENSKLKTPIKLCRQCEQLMDQHDDYKMVFVKRELIGRVMNEAIMNVKVRQEPLSVYMLFGKPYEGREVIFVEGKNNNELLVHETGIKSLAGTLSLDPHGSMAMKENHHSINKFGIKNLVTELADLWISEAHLPGIEVKYYPKAKIGEKACKTIEVTHPKEIAGASYHITRFYLDAKTNIPVRLQHYSFPTKPGAEPVLYEEYTFLEFEPNQGFKDIDFDIENPDYNF